MLFHADNNTLTPADRKAEKWLSGRSGKVDLQPVSATKRRNLDQNAKYHAWCAEVAYHLPEQYETPIDVHRYVKLSIGLKVLYADDIEKWEDLRFMLMSIPREKRLEASDLLQCTRLLTVGQMKQIMDWMEIHFAEQGVILD